MEKKHFDIEKDMTEQLKGETIVSAQFVSDRADYYVKIVFESGIELRIECDHVNDIDIKYLVKS